MACWDALWIDSPELSDVFRGRMRELGWAEGHKLDVDEKYLSGSEPWIVDMLGEFVQHVDVIVVKKRDERASGPAHAAKLLTYTSRRAFIARAWVSQNSASKPSARSSAVLLSYGQTLGRYANRAPLDWTRRFGRAAACLNGG